MEQSTRTTQEALTNLIKTLSATTNNQTSTLASEPIKTLDEFEALIKTFTATTKNQTRSVIYEYHKTPSEFEDLINEDLDRNANMVRRRLPQGMVD